MASPLDAKPAETPDEFKTRFYAQANDLGKIQLCIREERYTIWQRGDKPSLSADALKPILALPATHPVKREPRKSGGKGTSYVVEMSYKGFLLGTNVEIYFKGYFGPDGETYLRLWIQSLRPNQ